MRRGPSTKLVRTNLVVEIELLLTEVHWHTPTETRILSDAVALFVELAREFEVDTKTQSALAVNTQVLGEFVRLRACQRPEVSVLPGGVAFGAVGMPGPASDRSHVRSSASRCSGRVALVGGSGLPVCDRKKRSANASTLGEEVACRRGAGERASGRSRGGWTSSRGTRLARGRGTR
ncbi:hypothetical protein EDB85DRAFT_2034550 [Lactarius pseudohatsudake]|nr:hypothetical protein EDB85DRAFT_2034550 [Lactarius pseudohatsudake]